MLRYHSAFLSNVTRLLVWPHSCSLEMKRRVRASAWDKWQKHCNLFYKEWRGKKRRKEKKKRLGTEFSHSGNTAFIYCLPKGWAGERGEGQMCALGLTCWFSGVMNILINPMSWPNRLQAFSSQSLISARIRELLWASASGIIFPCFHMKTASFHKTLSNVSSLLLIY